MSKKKDNTTAYLLLGLAAFLMLQQQQQPAQHYVPTQSYIPPRPPQNNGAAWQQWVNSIVNLYGTVSSLWQPGGPFYNVPTQNVYDVITPNPGMFPTDPNIPSGGWV